MSDPNDVVVTGWGAVTAAGVGVEAFRQAAREGRTGVTTITEFDLSRHPVRMAAMVKGFDPTTILDAKQVRLAARIVQFALGAATQAVESAGPGALDNGERIATVMGTGMGGLEVLAEQMEVCHVKGPRRVSPFSVPQLMDNASAAWIALKWGMRGPAYSVATACSTSLDGLGLAHDLIRSGRVDAAVVGGSEAGVSPYTLGSFAAGGFLSARNDDPATASRPFDRDRDGFVLGEGACVFMVERRDRAQKRGAKVLARVAGYGATQDAYHVVEPRPDGSGLALAMQMAMAQAKVEPRDVGYIAAHGIGSVPGDLAESRAIRTALGAEADRVPVGAVKSITGYVLGPAGILNAMAATLAVSEGLLTPCVTLQNQDPACELNVLKGRSVEKRVDCALANSAGYGGHNACVVLTRD
jgi:3-oxoacyl-[acyl-carrier-protein] synthase II